MMEVKMEIDWDPELGAFVSDGNPVSGAQALRHWKALDADWTARAWKRMAIDNCPDTGEAR